MWPRLPEVLIIAWICLATFGLLKLDALGEVVWRMRCVLDPSVDGDDSPAEDSNDGGK